MTLKCFFGNIVLAGLSALSVSAATITADPDMIPYVYPGNAPERPEVPRFMPGGQQFVRIADDGRRIVTVDVASGNESGEIFNIANTRETVLDTIEGFTLSPDGKKILVWNGKEMIYRRSFRAKYYVYDCHSRILRPLSDASATQRAPIFSPDSRMVAFGTDDNNIRIRKIDYNTEVAVTTDGAVNKVINGVPDWTYEEEFTTTCSMVWAPDNLTLCYIRYDEEDVPSFSMTIYDDACRPKPEYALYPGEFVYKYPVAGMTNSKVSLHSYDVETRKIKRIDLPADRAEYIPRLEYGGAPDRLMAVALNRDQNRMEIFTVNPRAAVAKSLLVEENKNGWIEPISYQDLKFLDDCFILPSGRSGYTHLYRYGYSGAMQQQLTKGNFDVTALYGYVTATGVCYYQSTAAGPVNRVVSRVDAKGKVTDLSPAEGWADAWFSNDASAAMLSHSSVARPPLYTLVNPLSGKTLRTLEDNADMASRYASVPRREFFTVPADSAGPSLNGYVVRPAGFDASRRYPVVMYQYSGPGSQEVVNKWSVDWETYFAMKGFMVVCVDGRGTGGRGAEFRQAVYRNLGHYETIDQIRAARYAASMPGADGSRMGMFGWSYGGYETLMAISDEASPFKAAVAVAPVTDWRYYDTVYAERYMLPPSRNPQGYVDSAPVNRVENVGCRLLIMHGTSDDNVHLSNTMQYASALIAGGKFCDMFLFPGMNHSINGCDTRRLLYSRMLDYFRNNL